MRHYQSKNKPTMMSHAFKKLQIKRQINLIETALARLIKMN